MERFWSKVDVRGPDECWQWRGAVKNNGYGCFYFGGRLIGAHRACYILSKGEIGEGLHVIHACDNRSCVNPKHLREATRQENMTDMVRKGRSSRGAGRYNAKLTHEQVREIRAAVDSGRSNPNRISVEMGVPATTIRQIANRTRWIYE